MRQRFSNYVEKHTPYLPKMPLTHNTSGLFFRDIIFDGKITPVECTVFREEYTYFFYGRPAYKVSSSENPSTINDILPVCFLFKPDTFINVKCVYPFDSGAFQGDKYKSVIKGKYTIDDFNLGNTLDNVPRLISAFFGSNKNYYKGQTKKNLKPYASDMEIDAYYRLIQSQGLEIDDRKYTVEIIVDYIVPLKDNLIAVFLPRNFMQDPEIEDLIINQLDVYFETYETVNGLKPDYYNYDLFKSVKKYLKRKSII